MKLQILNNKLQFVGTIALILTILQGAHAQTIDFAAQVSFDYSGKSLEYVLDDISNKYSVKFSYSRDIIPVDQEIFAQANQLQFVDALNEIFDQTQVIYGFIGDQLVLSFDGDKIVQPPGGYLPPGLEASQMGGDAMPLADSSGDKPEFIKRPQYEIPTMPSTSPDPLPVPASLSDRAILQEYIDEDRKRLLYQAERDGSKVRAQFTVFPPLRYDTDAFSDDPVNISMNLFGGVNDHLEGVEVGGFVNVLRGNMDGIQVAGLSNVVGGSSRGFQVAGLVNTTRYASTGVQVGGIGNLASNGGDVLQIAGIANVARDQVQGQISGIANIAEDVAQGQIGLINVASHVRGAQIGLINIADSSGVSIGLFSFVKRRGYHSFELAGEDAIYGNLNLRIGVRPFYNIFHIGANERAETWSLGYGIGSSIRTGYRNYLQLELMARHVNENENWTNDLNLLNQFKVIWDIRLAEHLRLAIGPSYNVMVSRLYNVETDKFGSEIPPYTFFDETYFNRGGNNPVNVKMWVGFHVGIRIGSRW